MKKILGLISLMGLFLIFSSCVTTKTAGNYPVKSIDKEVQIDKMAEWKSIDETYGPARIEVFFVGNTKIKRYIYQGNGVTYRILFYNDKIHSIVTDR